MAKINSLFQYTNNTTQQPVITTMKSRSSNTTMIMITIGVDCPEVDTVVIEVAK